MDKESNAIQQLIKGIQIYVQKLLQDSPRDMTYTAVVQAENVEGYDIKMNGVVYTNVHTIGGTCTINEVVYVMLPQNNSNNMIILKG